MGILLAHFLAFLPAFLGDEGQPLAESSGFVLHVNGRVLPVSDRLGKVLLPGQQVVFLAPLGTRGRIRLWRVGNGVHLVSERQCDDDSSRWVAWQMPQEALVRASLVVELIPHGGNGLAEDRLSGWVRDAAGAEPYEGLAVLAGVEDKVRLYALFGLFGSYVRGDKSLVRTEAVRHSIAMDHFERGRLHKSRGAGLAAVHSFDLAWRVLCDCDVNSEVVRLLRYATAFESLMVSLRRRDPASSLRYSRLVDATMRGLPDEVRGKVRLGVELFRLRTRQILGDDVREKYDELISRLFKSGEAADRSLAALGYDWRSESAIRLEGYDASIRDIERGIKAAESVGDEHFVQALRMKRVEYGLVSAQMDRNEVEAELEKLKPVVERISLSLQRRYWLARYAIAEGFDGVRLHYARRELDCARELGEIDLVVDGLQRFMRTAVECGAYHELPSISRELRLVQESSRELTGLTAAQVAYMKGFVLLLRQDYRGSLQFLMDCLEQVRRATPSAAAKSLEFEAGLALSTSYAFLGMQDDAENALRSAGHSPLCNVDSRYQARLEVLSALVSCRFHDLPQAATILNGRLAAHSESTTENWSPFLGVEPGALAAMVAMQLGDFVGARSRLKNVVASLASWRSALATGGIESSLADVSRRCQSAIGSLLAAADEAVSRELDFWPLVAATQGLVWEALRKRDVELKEEGPQRRELRRVRKLLADAVLYGPRLGDGTLEELARRKEQLERAVAAGRSPPRSLGGRSSVAAPLAPRPAVGEVLLQFLAYREGPDRQRRYCVLVVPPRGPTERIELGLAEPLDRAIAAWRRALADGQDDAPWAREVGSVLWRPLAPHLPADAETLLIRPAGALSALPWPALLDPVGQRRLVRDYACVISMGPPRGARLPSPNLPPPRGPTLLVGDVAYDAAGDAPELADGVQRAAEGGAWPSLPATAAEIRGIQQLAPGPVRTLQGPAATSQAVLAGMADAQILHLASHGYFAEQSWRSALQMEQTLGEQLGVERPRVAVVGRHPLTLCGLILARDSQRRRLLSAESVAAARAANLRLVVLSACETGRGDTAGGEGVLGLHRAFHLAGAETVMGSLWRVDDRGTQHLMELFYQHLWRDGLPVPEALRRAQLAMLSEPAGRSPDRGPAGVRRVAQPAPESLATASWAGFLVSHSSETPAPGK